FSGQNPPSGAVIYYSLKTSLEPAGRNKPAPATAKAAEEKSAQGQKAEPQGKEPGQKQPSGAAVPPKSEEAAAEAKPAEKAPPVTLEILDQKGQVIRKYPPKQQGEAGAGE